MNSPDNHSRGFLADAPKAGRYENNSDDPENVAAKIADLIPRGAKVLDVGCGTGSVSKIIAELSGAKLLGIEPDTERAMTAQARGLNVFEGCLTEEFLREHGPFDVVVFADVLEHLPNPAAVVALAATGLVPGGRIVASVPNVAHYFVRLDLLRGRFDYDIYGIMDSTHLRWFTRKTIRDFFERLGFRVTALDGTVNIDLPGYDSRMPWRWLNRDRRRRWVGRLVRRWPGLFACQHVICARLPGPKA